MHFTGTCTKHRKISYCLIICNVDQPSPPLSPIRHSLTVRTERGQECHSHMPMLTGDQDFCCYRDQLRAVPSQLTAFLTKKHYLHATQLLVSALSLGEGSLEGVEALREVRTDLQTKKQVSSLHHLPLQMYAYSSCFSSHFPSTADIIR